MSLKITNNQSARVLVQVNGFEFGRGVRCHPKATVRGDGRYEFKFYQGVDPISKKEIWVPELFLEPGQETTTYIPIDDLATDESALKEHYRKSTAGVVHYRTIWLGEVPTAKVNEDKI